MTSISNINISEKRLGEITRKTFLSLWSYQNPFYSKGKELCDVLVIFDNNVIIMSDKFIKFNKSKNLNTSWERWYKKAVIGSVKQLRGALKTISNFPESIYCDAQTSSPFPLKIPNIKSAKIYLIAIANGAESAALQHTSFPSLRIDTKLNSNKEPFSIGLFYPEVVHVFNKTSIEAIFESLDTVKDFVDYLNQKEQKLSNKDRYIINGEENLIATYLSSSPGNVKFHFPEHLNEISNGIWDAYIHSEKNFLRKKARKPSYIIDNIIESTAEEYKSGRLVIGQHEPLIYHEEAFRLIASESRLGRQLISLPLLDIISEDSNCFWCDIVESIDTKGLLYVWLIYPEIPKNVCDEELEEVLLRTLSQYMLVAQYKFRHAENIFGICLPNIKTERTSLLFRLLDGTIFTRDMEQQAKKLESEYGILDNIQPITYRSSR